MNATKINLDSRKRIGAIIHRNDEEIKLLMDYFKVQFDGAMDRVLNCQRDEVELYRGAAQAIMSIRKDLEDMGEDYERLRERGDVRRPKIV